MIVVVSSIRVYLCCSLVNSLLFPNDVCLVTLTIFMGACLYIDKGFGVWSVYVCVCERDVVFLVLMLIKPVLKFPGFLFFFLLGKSIVCMCVLVCIKMPICCWGMHDQLCIIVSRSIIDVGLCCWCIC